MKAILYAGAVLMTGASIYGFIDFKKSGRKLSNLYETNQKTTPQRDAIIEVDKKEAAEKSVTPVKAEAPVKVKKQAALLTSASKTEDKIIKPDNTPVTLETKEKSESLKTAALKENSNGKKIKVAKKKRVNYKMFSRGALEERYIEKITPKPEIKKTETKEQ